MPANLSRMSRDELTRRLHELLGQERATQTEFLRHLGELDHRRAYLELGYASLFDYCTRALGLLSGAAYRRIVCARLLRRCPQLGPRLADGRLSLTTAALLKDVLTEDRAEELLERAAGLTKEQTEALVALYRPGRAARESVRPAPGPRMVALPAACVPASMASTATGAAAAVGSPAGSAVGSPAGSAVAESSALAVPAVAAGRSTSVEHAATTVLVAVPRREPDRIQPVDAERRVLRVTVTQGLLDDLAQARAALSHKFPEGRFEDVVREGLRLVIEAHVRRRGGVPARAAETAGPAPVGHDAPVMARAPVVAAAVRMTAAAPAPPAAAPAPVAAAAPAVASSAAAAARVTTAAPVAAAPSRAEGPAEFVPRDRGESRHEPLRRRRIPVGVQRAVWARDGGRCTFTGPDGTRCGSRYQLQLDHLVLAAYGGPDTVANLRLVCRSHNLHAAAELLGSGFMDRCRTGRSRPRALPPGEVAMGAPASR